MTLRGRGIEIKKLNRKRREKRKKEKKNEKEGEGKEREKREGERERTRKLPARPPTEKPNVVTTHPVAPANYIMIFNGPKSKTRPPKIFGSGIDWDGWESSEMS